MNRFLKSVVIPCLVPLTFVACGKNNDGKNNNPIQNVEQAAKDGYLQGKIFRGECGPADLTEKVGTAVTTGGEVSLQSVKEQYQFAGANITHATLFYADKDCSKLAGTYKEIGSFKTDEGDMTPDGGKTMDINYNKVTLTINSDDGLTVALNTKACGKSDWQTDQETDVTAKASDANCYQVSVPRVVRDAYLLENGKNKAGENVRNIYFGPRKASGDTSRTANIDKGVVYQTEAIK